MFIQKNKNTFLSGIQSPSILNLYFKLRNFLISQFGIGNIVLIIFYKS
jgi:hypothetical protein